MPAEAGIQVIAKGEDFLAEFSLESLKHFSAGIENAFIWHIPAF
jgi:hypothetical protein